MRLALGFASLLITDPFDHVESESRVEGWGVCAVGNGVGGEDTFIQCIMRSAAR